MKKLFGLAIIAATLASPAIAADPRVDTLIANAVAACAKIATLESNDIGPMLEASRTLNSPTDTTVVNVDVKFSVSDGLYMQKTPSRSLTFNIRLMGNVSMSIDCSSGYHRR